MTGIVALIGAAAALVTSIGGLIAVVRGQNQTHQKLDTVSDAVATSNGTTLGHAVEQVVEQTK